MPSSNPRTLPADPSRRRLLQGAMGLLAAGGPLASLSACGGAEDADTAYLRLVNATLALYSTSGTSGPSAAYAFTKDTDYTVIAYGTLTAGMALKRLEESTATPNSGSLSLRLLHTAPLLDGLDLYITNASSLSSLTPLATVSTLGELSDFATLDSGTYRVRLTVAGDHSTVVFDSGSTTASRISFADQVVVTLVVVPRSSGSLPDVTALPEKLAAGVLTNSLG
jgi:hypothetical protein